MCRRGVKWELTVCTALLVLGAVGASAQSVPLNYNFNGLLQGTEWSGGWPGDPGVADLPNGFRSISDRGIRVDGLAGAFGTDPLIGATGLTYSIVTAGDVVDMVMLGNRNLVDGGNWAFDAVADTDNIGIQPAWLPNPDQSGPQTTTIASPILMDADTQIGILYNISNGGGSFQLVLGFTDTTTVTISLFGPDWYGDQASWWAGNSMPSPIPPFGGIASLARMGVYTSVYWVDNPADTTATLNVAEAVVTVAQLLMDGFDDITGKSLSSITIQSASNSSSYAIYAVSVGGGSPPPANDECANATLVTEGVYKSTSGGATGTEISSCGFGFDTLDVWYRYQASQTGTARASLCGSGFDTTLAIYDACGGTEIACNDDYCDLQSQVDFAAVAGNSYYIRIAGNGASAGSYTLRITNPADIMCGPIVNPANGHSYYLLTPYSWTDAEARAVELGGHLVTLNDGDERTWVLENIVRYDGTARTSWIGQTDQAEEGVWKWINGQHTSYTAWNGGEPNNAGEEDYAEMQDGGGWNDVTNDQSNHFGIVEIPTPPANDECANAIAVTEGETYGDSDGATGATTSSCGTGDTADVWFDYTASQTGTTRFSLCGDAADELFDTTVAVYSACGGTELACNDNVCGEQSQVDFAVVVGTHYYIRVAGNAGATGGFRMYITNPPGIICGPVTNPANGSQYYLLTKDSWTGAEVRAQAMGGHLVTINDAAENTWVRDNVLTCVPGSVRWAWIGLSETAPSSGIWVWSSGQIAAYRNWGSGEPNLLDTETAAQMVTDGTWNNLPDAGHSWLGGEYAMVEIDTAGACCFADESCTILLPADCDTQGGLFIGGGTTCDPNPCLAGACCQPDGTCSVVTPIDCVLANGTFDGAPSCTPNPCTQPGACCLDSVCSLSPTVGPFWCISQGGLYQGDDTTCTTTPCPQDECADAFEVFSDTPVYGTNTFATGTDITSCADGNAGDWADVWYKWTAPACDTSVSFSLCDGTGFDTSLAVFASCGGAELGCDDDGCGTGGGPSVVTLNATAKTTYYIRIAGWDGGTGTFKLTITNSPCTGACCVGSTCSVTSASACAAAGGVYQGDGVPCGANTCGCHGDANCDGQIDFADINAFVDAIVHGDYCDGTGVNADVDGNGSVGFEDINPFVDMLTQNPLPIPC